MLIRLNSCPFAVKLPGVPAIAGAAQAVVSPRVIAIAPAGKRRAHPRAFPPKRDCARSGENEFSPDKHMARVMLISA